MHGLDAVVWQYDVASDRFTFVSDYAQTLLGHPVTAWTDFESWTMLIHPDDRTQAAAFCRTETTRGKDHTFEYRAVRPDGSVVWLRDIVRVARGADGSVAQLYGVLLDITEPRQAQEDLLGLATEQEAQSSIAIAVAEDRPADEVFAIIAESAAHALGAEAAAVIEFAGDEIALRGLFGLMQHRVGETLSTQIVGALRDVRRTGRAQRFSRSEMDAHDQVGQAVRREQITSAALVPVTVAGRTWGCLAVGLRGGELPPDTEPRMERLARTAATGVSHADARARLVQQATTDALTGLANHRAFQERLRTEVARAHRYQRPLAVVVFDLDGFKLVNDTHGHAAGDRALAEVAGRLRSLARPGDVLARTGGDEFAWILPETDSMGGYSAAERARAAIVGRELLPGIA
ncbi:MAG: diguanylate cyclase, partial [Miltoncostaeaceae bacterium]